MAVTKAKTSTALSNDEKIQKLIKIVEDKKAKIAKATKASYRTNMSFSFTENGVSDRINLNVNADTNLLIKILAFLRTAETGFTTAAIELESPDAEFTWQGYTVEDWKHDLSIRLSRLNISKEKAELEGYEETLNSLISPELKAQMKIAELEKALS